MHFKSYYLTKFMQSRLLRNATQSTREDVDDLSSWPLDVPARHSRGRKTLPLFELAHTAGRKGATELMPGISDPCPVRRPTSTTSRCEEKSSWRCRVEP